MSQLIERLNATRLLPQRLAELGSTKKSVEKSLQQSKALDAVSYTIRKCSSAVASTRTMLVSRLLELHKPLIRSLYRRLQPHPVFTDIDFEIQEAYKEAELYFKVFSEDGAVNEYPSTIFSASQLNALAVCIFLALSLHSLGPLSLMILDDPIQSMDDINVLGLCDVIRQLKDNRQLFISTHNEDFYRLLLNKLRPLSSDSRVRGIRFESWSREGPQLKDEEVEFTDLRIDVNRMASLIGSPAA